MNPAQPCSQCLCPCRVTHVPKPRGSPTAHAGGQWSGTTSSSLEHSGKATSPSWLGLSSASTGFCFTPIPENTAPFRDPSWSWVLRWLHHILEGSQVVDRPSSSAQIRPTDALSLEKSLSASAVSQGRDAWLLPVLAVPSAKETAR